MRRAQPVKRDGFRESGGLLIANPDHMQICFHFRHSIELIQTVLVHSGKATTDRASFGLLIASSDFLQKSPIGAKSGWILSNVYLRKQL